MDIATAVDVFGRYVKCKEEDIAVCFSHDGCGGCPHALTEADIVDAMKIIISKHGENKSETDENYEENELNQEDE